MKRVRAPASGNRAKGSKQTQLASQRTVEGGQEASVEPSEAGAALPAPTTAERDEPTDFSPVEALPVAHLLRVDRRFANEAAVSWFRARYPVRVLSWPEPHRPTDEDLGRARAIVEEIGVAIMLGDLSKWERVRRAHDVLFATDTRDLKIAACLKAIRSAVRVARDPRHRNVAEGLIGELARHEPAFANLRASQVRKDLESTQPHEAVKKGGRGHMGPLGLAAILTVSVGAFGVERDTDMRRVKSLLDVAVRRAEHASTRPREK